MSDARHGVVAAGHPLTAEAGAGVLREGGNAVDAALAAMLTSFVSEPLLTGLGAGGHMLVAGAGTPPAVLDFFVSSPTRERPAGDRADRPAAPVAELLPIVVSFGDAVQVFHVGPASCGVYGTPAGVCEAAVECGARCRSSVSRHPAVRARALRGVLINAGQAYVAEILVDLLRSTPMCAPAGAGRSGTAGG